MERSSELGLLLNQDLKLFSAAKVNYTHLAFQEAPINSRSWTDPRHNCLLSDDDRLALKWKVPETSKTLFILGAQKAGTTYLFNMLMTHPGFILSKGENAEERKELSFFNTWPLPTSEEGSFPSRFPNAGSVPEGSCFIDGTPNYLYNSMAAPRIQAIVPHAKFVIVLRDPVMRQFSSWSMMKRKCPADSHSYPHCLPFWVQVADSIHALQKRDCLFNNPGSKSTWFSCFGCSVDKPGKGRDEACSAKQRPPTCNAPSYGIAASTYAAQLSWWFSFFPPDRFLILRSTDIQNPDLTKKADILNKIKAFAGVAGDDFKLPEKDEMNTPAKREVRWWEGVHTNPGVYNVMKLHVEDAKAMLLLRLLNRQPLADLTSVLHKHYQPDFPELDEEVSEAVLRTYIEEHYDSLPS